MTDQRSWADAAHASAAGASGVSGLPRPDTANCY